MKFIDLKLFIYNKQLVDSIYVAFNAILKLIASPSVCAREKVGGGGGGGERDRQTDRQKDSERDKERQREKERDRERQRESWEN